MLSKDAYMHSKEADIHSKRACIHSKEVCTSCINFETSSCEDAHKTPAIVSKWTRGAPAFFVPTQESRLCVLFSSRCMCSNSSLSSCLVLPWFGRVRSTRSLAAANHSHLENMSHLSYCRRIKLSSGPYTTYLAIRILPFWYMQSELSDNTFDMVHKIFPYNTSVWISYATCNHSTDQ